MAQGVLAGVVCGLVVAGAGLGALSLVSGRPLEPAPGIVVGAAPNGLPVPDAVDAPPQRVAEDTGPVVSGVASRPEAPEIARPEVMAAEAMAAESGAKVVSDDPTPPGTASNEDAPPPAPRVEAISGVSAAPAAAGAPPGESAPAAETVSAPMPDPVPSPEAAEAPGAEVAPQPVREDAAPAATQEAPARPIPSEEGDAPEADASAQTGRDATRAD